MLLPSTSSSSPRAALRGARSVVLPLLAAVLVLPLLAVLGAGPADAASPRAPSPGPRAPQSADLQPIVQTDGTVYSVEIVGNQVWAVGDFDRARPPGVARGGAGEVPRAGLLVADVRTGELLPISHALTGTAFTSSSSPGAFCTSLGSSRYVCDAAFRVTASPDGSRVYVGGDFTAVDGQARYRMAAFDTATGALVADFRPAFSSRVRAIAPAGDRVYVGGGFTSVDGQPRQRLAAVGTDGSLLGWDPGADRTVWSAAAATDGSRVVVGGQFDQLAGQPRRGLGAVTASGASAPWAADLGANTGSFPTDMEVVGGTVYVGVNGEGGPPQLDGRLAATVATGARLWTDQCYGATQAVAVDGGQLYSSSHAHNCAALDSFPERSPRYYQRILAESLDAPVTNRYGQQVPRLSHWFPNTDDGPASSPFLNGPWAVAAEAGTVVVGGEFLEVNGVPQQGLARFVPRGSAPRRSGPQTPFRAPEVSSLVRGEVRVAFTPAWDRDDPELTYTVLRDESPVAELTVASGFWAGSQEQQVFLDTGVQPGATHTYRLRVRDGDGNSIGSPSAAPVTVSSAGPRASVTGTHRAGATHLWRLGGTGAAALRDEVGGLDLLASSGVTTGRPGALAGDPDTAVRVDGTSSGQLRTASRSRGSQAASVETWFRTTDSGSGALVGQGTSATGTGGSSDRVLFLAAGRLRFGVDNRNFSSPVDHPTVATSSRVDDGQWHHAVATTGDHGLEIYLDGQLAVADRTAAHSSYDDRYWKIGGTTLAQFGYSDPFPAADLDEVAVYDRVLTPAQVSAAFAAGRSLQAPTARATASCTGLTCSVDGTGSTDDGPSSALTYAWDLGDGTSATGPTPSRTYATAGTRTVTLRVTDGDGLVGSTTVQVDPQAPSTFAARDTFSRTSARGWGSAERGGPWSLRYSDSSFSVDGAAGRVSLPGSGRLRTAWLAGVAETSTSFSAVLTPSRLPAGSNQAYLWAVARQVELDRDYRARVRVHGDGSVRLALARRGGTSVDTTLGAEVAVPGLVARAGQGLRVRVEAEGTSPTRLRARVWADGSPEPDAWQVEATDTTAALQSPGGVAVAAYLTGSESAELRVGVDDVAAVAVAARPVAAFSATCSGRTCSLDAGGSTAGDGSGLSYRWDLGDGTAATGRTVSRTYAADGSYPVTLTVTTSEGQTDATQQVVTTQTSTVASDAFGRDVASGLGLADLGGEYALRYSRSSFSVSGGAARVSVPGGGRYRDALLPSATARDTDLAVTFAVDRLPVGGAQTYLWGVVRSQGTDVDYRARVRVGSDGSALLALVRRDGSGTDVTLATVAVPGLTVAPGQPVALRVQAVGASPTQLRAKVWPAGAAEPGAWQVEATDATGAQQTAGAVGFAAYLSGSGGDPLVVTVDDLRAEPPA